MNELQIKAIFAGLFFGTWPLFMNKSGLSGSMSSGCFAAVAFIVVLPFALCESRFTIPTANWAMVAIAGFLGALGLLSFNGMLASASPQNIGALIVLTTLVQIVVPALHQTFMSGQLSFDKACGYVLAAVAAYLLSR